MKLEKFRVGSKNKVTIISIMTMVIILMAAIIIYESYALYEDKKSFNVLNGTVPLFGSTTGSVELAYTVDGQLKTDPFPTKESKYIAKNVTCDNGVEASWNNMEWALVVTNSNNKEKVKCTIDFTKKKIEVYGIERALNSSSSAWTRTNDAVGKVANAQVGTTAVRNDFDGIYPWNEIKSYNYMIDNNRIIWYGQSDFKFDGSKGEVLTYIPEFYYQRYQDSTKEYIQISKEYIEGYTKSEAFSVGRYPISGSANNVHSISGIVPLYNKTISEYRTYAKNLGNGFGLIDYHYFILQMLYLVEYADYNSQAKLGNGYTNSTNMTTVKSGGCDALGMHSGSLSNSTSSSVIYRGIEDIYGKLFQFIDGINIKDHDVYVCYDQSKYVSDKFDGCYKKLGYSLVGDTGYIKQLGYDRNNPLIGLSVSLGGTGSTYIPDYYWNGAGNRIALIGGVWGDSSVCGLWSWSDIHASTVAADGIGSRLIKLT